MSGQGLPKRKIVVNQQNNTFNIKARTQQEAMEIAKLLFDIYQQGGNVKVINGQIYANLPNKK